MNKISTPTTIMVTDTMIAACHRARRDHGYASLDVYRLPDGSTYWVDIAAVLGAATGDEVPAILDQPAHVALA